VIQAVFGLAEAAKAFDVPSLTACYGPWVGVRSNHVVDANGNFSGSDGSSRSISTKEDRELLLALRSISDLIVVDASTARLEQYSAPKSRTPLAIVSLSGDFTNIPAVENSLSPIFLFTANGSPQFSENSKAIILHAPENPFEGFLEWAKAQFLEAILLEAGPTLTAKAFEAGIVLQSAVTRTGLLPNADPFLVPNPFDAEAKLISLALAPGASFSLWNH
jgi:riboflavin biosynthesis pyrimidine reductase